MFEILCMVWLAVMLLAADRDLARLEHQSEALFNLNKIGCEAARAVVDVGDIQKLSDEKIAIEKVEEMKQSLRATTGGARAGIEKFPELGEALANLETLEASILRYADSVARRVSDRSSAAGESERMNRLSLVPLLIEFKGLSQQILALETDVKLQAPREVESIRCAVLAILVVTCFLSTVVAAMLSYFFRDIVWRLSRISDNAQRLATARVLTAAETGADEIAQLDRVLHRTDEVLRNLRRHELSVLDNAADIVCALDGRLRFVAVNRAARNVWGCEPADLLGMSLLKLVSGDTIEHTKDILKEIADQSLEGEFENLVRAGDGKLRNCHWTVSWSKTAARFSCVVHDVTELRAIERLKQRFIAMVSHDLRSPLTSTGVTFEMALEGVRGDLPEPVLDEIRGCHNRLSRLRLLIEELLEIEKIESGTVAFQAECVSAFNVCVTARELVSAAAETVGVKIKVPRAEDNVLMLGEEARLIQALVKLLVNAIERSPANSTVTVTFLRAGDQVGVKVSDEGVLVPETEAGLMFERFHSPASDSTVEEMNQPSVGSLSTASKIKGQTQITRLSLSIVKAIVERHGGKVGVEHGENQGNSFWFTIPSYQGEERDEEP